MSDPDSNSEYPPISQNLFDVHSVPVEYPEVIEPSTTPLPTLPPLPHPTTRVTMVEGSSSGKLHMFSFSAQVVKKTPVNVTLDRIERLTSQDHYRIWSASMNVVLKGIKAYEVVVDGVSAADDGDQTDMDVFEHLNILRQPYSYRWSHKTFWRTLSNLRTLT